MGTESNGIIMKNKVFAWIVLAAGLILIIPLTAMQFTNKVNWSLSDFVIMGALLSVTGSMFVLVARRLDKKYRVLLGIVFALAFLYVWAELAVGIFTNWGS